MFMKHFALLVMLFIVFSCPPLCAQDAENIRLKEIRQIAEDSKQLLNSGYVKEIRLQPSPTRYQDADDWVFWVDNKAEHWSSITLVPRNYRKPPVPGVSLKQLNSLADQQAVTNYTLLKIYSIKDTEDPKKTFLINAHRNEFNIAAYTDTDKRVCYVDLKPLEIQVKPALFFATDTDAAGKFFKILIMDENNVATLHRGVSKYAIVKYYPATMTVSASGSITLPLKKLYVWKGKREEE